ncbi:MAG: malto-oligosyltrehalose synthase [Actinomycetaceae bacterium]|nr:malto-oligosyltrehalose synthase [Arcanobacterium sp.]MDD7505863.1 malto-oligosyltrehalose synthase [Actinomycetaceae bacterium]MDY6142988.1 malto-oligosyltrehalose synthase [Arcanobacterium sp.]
MKQVRPISPHGTSAERITPDTGAGFSGRTHSHLPKPGKHVPTSTYRLQMGPQFTFEDAERIVPYLKDLGVTDVYLSPILQATPESTHGYDVVDHHHISTQMGGREGFERLSSAIHRDGMHVIVDVVPNHMAVPTPLYLNRALWQVLRDGSSSPYAQWFDLQLHESGEGVLMPVLGDRIGNVIARGELVVEKMIVPGFDDEGEVSVLRYFDHVFPLRQGTESLPITELLNMQFYRLAYWRMANEELNYRRFFDVDTLVAIRVEDDAVFDESHALLLELYKLGFIDGFRIDHPDGLANPQAYLKRLYEVTDGAWIVAEKILEGTESLPSQWTCSGTTGYDALRRIQGVFVNPNGIAQLIATYYEYTGQTSGVHATELKAKKQITNTSLFAEVERLAHLVYRICQGDVRLRDYSLRSIRIAIASLASNMTRYRAYVTPGETPSGENVQVLRDAQEQARRSLEPDNHDALDLVTDLFLGNEIGSAGLTDDAARHEVVVRFQQLCGPVMAKSIEDTAFYRYNALAFANEVGAGPQYASCSPDEFHEFVRFMHNAWPASSVTLTTHDTKRGEDVRAKIAALTSFPVQWQELVESIRELTGDARPTDLDPSIEYLMVQTLVGTYMHGSFIETERLDAYLLKAAREQKTWTTWTEQNEAAETALLDYAHVIISAPRIRELFDDFNKRIADVTRTMILGQKALALTAYGVADLYQGEEIVRNWLVDPDNRQVVDYSELERLLSDLDKHGLPGNPTLSMEKMWITSRLLRLRRSIPQLITRPLTYEALPVTSGTTLAFARRDGDTPVLITVVALSDNARHNDSGVSVVLPQGRWENVLTGDLCDGGTQTISTVTGRFPVAVLTPANKENY